MTRDTRTIWAVWWGSLVTIVVLIRWFGTALIPGDSVTYTAMARHPTRFTVSPWGFRLLEPWLLHILPVPIATGFWYVTVLSLAGTATALAALCTTLGLSPRAAVASAILFCCSFGCIFTVWDFRLVDPLAYLGTVLVLLCAARGRTGWAAALLIGLTLEKEWGVLLIPAFVACVPQRTCPRHWAPIGVGVTGTLGAYFLVRHWPGFGTGAYGDYYALAAMRQWIAGNILAFPRSVLTAWGALPLAAYLGRRRMPHAILPLTLVALAAVAQLLGAIDGPRMLAYAFPCVIPLAVAAVEPLPQRRWILCVVLLALSLLLQGVPLLHTLDDSAVMYRDPTLARLAMTGVFAGGFLLSAVPRIGMWWGAVFASARSYRLLR